MPAASMVTRRQCTDGTRFSSLAYAEISMVFAALFSPRGPKLQLYETDETDADPACHFLLPVRIAPAMNACRVLATPPLIDNGR